MKKKLQDLYHLQYIDSNLDELEELKGDLPGEIRQLEEQYEQLKAQKAELEQAMKNAFVQRDHADSEIIASREKLERYKSQQMHVKTNKEYDALTREMDNASETISRLEKEMEQLEGKATIARTDIEAAGAKVEELEKTLDEKRAQLKEVSKATEAEETKFRTERQKVVSKISKADMVMYERIRKAKGGKAVVPIKRGACGGCFNRVPPQKLLELRQNNRIYTCERCGRILVSDEIVSSVVGS